MPSLLLIVIIVILLVVFLPGVLWFLAFALFALAASIAVAFFILWVISCDPNVRKHHQKQKDKEDEPSQPV